MTKMQKKRLAFKLHPTTLCEMMDSIKTQGYGARGKSRWISEAIEDLLLQKDYWDLVSESDMKLKVDNMPESIFISLDLRIKIDNAILECRTRYPLLNGVQSLIVRTAIIRRNLRGGCVGSPGELTRKAI